MCRIRPPFSRNHGGNNGGGNCSIAGGVQFRFWRYVRIRFSSIFCSTVDDLVDDADAADVVSSGDTDDEKSSFDGKAVVYFGEKVDSLVKSRSTSPFGIELIVTSLAE